MSQSQQVLSAYSTVMNPMSTHQQRASAHMLLEQVRGNPGACREVAMELLRMPQPESRHLAAILMENVVKNWPNLNPRQRGQVRQDVAAILANVNTQEALYVREKIASVVNEVAKRDWPQDWPEYFDTLVSISNLGDHQRSMVLLVLRRLVEDVTHFSHDLAKKRCDQLLAELKQKAKPMLTFMVGGLQTQQAAWRESQGRNEVALRLAIALVETITGFLPWAAAAIIFDLNVPEILMSCLHDVHDLRMPAAEALLLLVERETGKMSIAPKFLFPLERTDTFGGALKSPHGSPQQKVAFQEVLGRILVAAGKRHLALVEKHDFAVPASYPEFLALMGQFLEHQDLVFCETTIPFFNHLLRTEVFKNSPAFDAVAPVLALAFARKLVGGINPDTLRVIRDVHFRDENDEAAGERKDPLGDFLARFTMVLKDVLRKLAVARPVLVLEVALEQVTRAMVGVLRVPQPPKMQDSPQSAMYLLLQGCIDLVDGVMKNGIGFDEIVGGTTASQRVKEQVSEGVRKLLLLFFEFETVNPLLMGLRIKALRCFAPYYRRNPKVLTAVLERLLGMVLYRSAGEEKLVHMDLHKTTMRVRKEACDSFLRLCVEMPDVLVDQLNPIASHVVEKLIKGDTTFAEKAMLRDALIAISTVLPDLNRQREFLKLILGPVLSVWTSTLMGETLSDCEKLLGWVGAAPNTAPKWDNGRSLVAVLETFRAAVKRSPAASSDLLPILLPNVFLLCRTLHRLWKPGHAAHAFLRAQLPVVFAPDQDLYADLVGRKRERNFALFVASWLSETRATAYKVVGVACKAPQFYLIPDLAARLNAFVFAEIRHVSVQHLTILVEYVIENLLMRTPPEVYGPFLGPLLPKLFAFLLDRLFDCWALESALKKGESAGGNTEDEVVQSKLAADLARSWFRVLLHVLHVEKNPNLKGKDGHATASPLCTFMMSSPDIVAGLIVSLASALCETCDFQTLSHTMEILERLIGMMLANPNLHPALGGPLLRALLKAVSKRANNENVGRFLRVAAEIYVRLRGVSPLPLNVLKMTGVTASSIAALETRLRVADADGAANKKTPKNRAQALQETLGDFVGGDVLGLGDGKSNSTFALEWLARHNPQ